MTTSKGADGTSGAEGAGIVASGFELKTEQLADDSTQRYDATVPDPVQVWVFCRLCRCRVQVRTVPRPGLPFRCFCGNSTTLAAFDVFADEDEARRFAATFEELYQTTKKLLRDADMPALPRTKAYRPGDLSRGASDDDASREGPGRASKVARLERAVTDAKDDVLTKHEALVALAEHTFARRERSPELRASCAKACKRDVKRAAEIVREAAQRQATGASVKVRFPTFRFLAELLEEDGDLEPALLVAQRAKSLGVPGHEERIARLREKVARPQP